jgi:proteasome lid subunit RPN8/RPN11
VPAAMRAAALDAVVRHARERSPQECCGLLLGRGVEIVEAVRARNIADDPVRRFLIDPRDHIAARRTARRSGVDLIGFYHSHPSSPAEPSATDLEELTYPGHLYLIVSLRAEPAELGLFLLDVGNFRRVDFVTVG